MGEKFVNPLRKEWLRRYNMQSDEVKKQIDDLGEMDPKDYQLEVIKKTKPELKDGDIFILSPESGVYFYGRVLKANIKSKYEGSFLDGNHLVFIFKGVTTEKNLDKFSADYDNLLIRPAVVHISYWRKGYFFNIGNQPITEEEKNLDFGLMQLELRDVYYCDETGVKIEKPKIVGWYAITTITGIASAIRYELLMDKGLLDH